MRYCILGKLFTAGSLARIIVLVESLGKTSMMLEDPKLVRTPRTLLMGQCCIIFECVITTIQILCRVLILSKVHEDYFHTQMDEGSVVALERVTNENTNTDIR